MNRMYIKHKVYLLKDDSTLPSSLSRYTMLTAQIPALGMSNNNKVTWSISNTLTSDVIVQVKKVSDNSVVTAGINSTTSFK